MITDQLPALQVILPLIAAPFCFLLWKWPKMGWLLATVIAWICTAIAIKLLMMVWAGNELQYEFGGWAPPWGIAYNVDRLNALILVIVSGLAAIMFPYSWASVQKEVDKDQQPLFYTSLLLCLAGLLGIAITGDAFNLFVLLEISSLSTYTLISFGKDRRALTASFQYLIMGTIGATFILIGVGILYLLTGTLNMADLANRIPDIEQTKALQTAFTFLVIGIGLKLAMFPLHLWLPNAYAYAPSAVSAFVAATATKVAIYILIRYLFIIFGVQFSFNTMYVQWLLVPAGLMAILFASVVAIFQHDIKRMLAYSSVAQIGYMLVAIGLVSASGLQAALIHVFNHALMKGALFLSVGAMCFHIGKPLIENMDGIGKRLPWTTAAFVVGGLSLIGVPLTTGFISKWYLVTATLEKGWWPVTAIVLLGSLLALIYIWRVVETAYLKQPADHNVQMKEAPLSMLVPTWILVIANIYFGIAPGQLTTLTESIATDLFR